MNDLGSLQARLAALIDDAAKRRVEERSVLAGEMQEFDSRLDRFEQVAAAWATDVIVPRLAALANALPGSGTVERTHGGRCVRVSFKWSAECPVAASLTVSLIPDHGYRHMDVQVEPRLIPMLAGHPPDARRMFDPESSDTRPLAQFLEPEILIFAEHFLRACEPDSPYQRQALVQDPVCGMMIRPCDAVETVVHGSRRHHFCSASCAERFRRDPGAWARAVRTSRSAS